MKFVFLRDTVFAHKNKGIFPYVDHSFWFLNNMSSMRRCFLKKAPPQKLFRYKKHNISLFTQFKVF